MLRLACCMLHVASRMLYAACCISHVVCCMLHLACCMLYVVCAVACERNVTRSSHGAVPSRTTMASPSHTHTILPSHTQCRQYRVLQRPAHERRVLRSNAGRRAGGWVSLRCLGSQYSRSLTDACRRTSPGETSCRRCLRFCASRRQGLRGETLAQKTHPLVLPASHGAKTWLTRWQASQTRTITQSCSSLPRIARPQLRKGGRDGGSPDLTFADR